MASYLLTLIGHILLSLMTRSKGIDTHCLPWNQSKAHGHAQCHRGGEIYSFHVGAWGGYIFFVNNLIVLLPSTYVEFLYTRYICVVQLYGVNMEVPMPLYNGHPEMTHRGWFSHTEPFPLLKKDKIGYRFYRFVLGLSIILPSCSLSKKYIYLDLFLKKQIILKLWYFRYD